MTDGTAPRTGARILVDGLAAQGVEHVFCVPGEGDLDALHGAPVALTVCRHGAGAAMMADAAARLTGRPGVCMVARGPGAIDAMAGIHTAGHDSVPLIVLIGQAERDTRGRGAFEGLDGPAAVGAAANGASRSATRAASPKRCRAPSTSPCRAAPARWWSRCPRAR